MTVGEASRAPFRRHDIIGAGMPETTQVSIAVLPLVTLVTVGGVVIDGGTAYKAGDFQHYKAQL